MRWDLRSAKRGGRGAIDNEGKTEENSPAGLVELGEDCVLTWRPLLKDSLAPKLLQKTDVMGTCVA